MTMTEEQKKEYLDNGGEYCPFCKRYTIQKVGEDFSKDTITMEMKCNACKETWTDTFTLTDVE